MATREPVRDQRPSPEALLAEAQRAARGRLKIFLGAAAGVGKTYEMLLAAQASTSWSASSRRTTAARRKRS